MRRLERVPTAGYAAGFDGFKGTHAVFIRRQPPKTVKLRANGWLPVTLPRVIRVVVPARGISLPNLNHGVIHGDTFAIEHTTGEYYAFSLHARSGQTPYRPVCGQAQMEKRPGGLRRNWQQVHDHSSNGVASRPRRIMLNW